LTLLELQLKYGQQAQQSEQNGVPAAEEVTSV
jgi:hypothetical protein